VMTDATASRRPVATTTAAVYPTARLLRDPGQAAQAHMQQVQAVEAEDAERREQRQEGEPSGHPGRRARVRRHLEPGPPRADGPEPGGQPACHPGQDGDGQDAARVGGHRESDQPPVERR
jgi:hypothetical protein